MQDWISVKDRLPEHCQEVIVYWNNFASRNYEVHAATYNADFEYFYIHKAGLAVKDVIHWMPLPKMPEKPYQEWDRISKERRNGRSDTDAVQGDLQQIQE